MRTAQLEYNCCCCPASARFKRFFVARNHAKNALKPLHVAPVGKATQSSSCVSHPVVSRFWLGFSVSSGGWECVIFNNNKLFLGNSSCFEDTKLKSLCNSSVQLQLCAIILDTH